MILLAYKLFRERKDGTLGSLFFNPRARIPVGKWLKAKAIRKKGFAFRPGWHACNLPRAPHLSKKNRVWCVVFLDGVTKHQRPATQGGLWFTAERLFVSRKLYMGVV